MDRARRRAASNRTAHQEPAQASAAASLEPGREQAHPGAEGSQPGGPADPSLDVAVYTCGCGLVFEAPVLTSVGCPHCGGHQAW